MQSYLALNEFTALPHDVKHFLDFYDRRRAALADRIRRKLSSTVVDVASIPMAQRTTPKNSTQAWSRGCRTVSVQAYLEEDGMGSYRSAHVPDLVGPSHRSVELLFLLDRPIATKSTWAFLCRAGRGATRWGSYWAPRHHPRTRRWGNTSTTCTHRAMAASP